MYPLVDDLLVSNLPIQFWTSYSTIGFDNWWEEIRTGLFDDLSIDGFISNLIPKYADKEMLDDVSSIDIEFLHVFAPIISSSFLHLELEAYPCFTTIFSYSCLDACPGVLLH